MMISLSTPFVAPLGHEKIIETDNTLQTEITKGIGASPYSGVLKQINKYIDNETIKRFGVQENLIEGAELREWYDGWTTANVNIRLQPFVNSGILEILSFNSYIQYFSYDDEWVGIERTISDTLGTKEITGYINSKYITNFECLSVDYPVPDNNDFKSYMPYTAITDRTSKQYNLQKNYAYTGDYGLRQVNGRYCVAIGTAFNAKIGDYADLILENGTIIPIIVSDIKDDKHTDSYNIATLSNGCVSEFICDISKIDNKVKQNGDISFVNKEWNSKVVTIKIYNKNIFQN